jgi:hypothetical protein
MFTLAEAVEAARVPASGLLTVELVPPFIGVTFTLTMVPSGTFAAAIVTVMGFRVPKGTTTSGNEYEPVGAAGADTPATEAIRRLGPLARATGPGWLSDGPLPLKFITELLLNASIRTRPPPPPPPLAKV